MPNLANILDNIISDSGIDVNTLQTDITLTTTGSSGASTFVSNVLNIPNYTLSGLGGVPTTRTLTINGTSFDLSADRSWTISAGVSGSGTTNYLSKWTSGTALGNSLIFENTNSIGIGTTSPNLYDPSGNNLVIYEAGNAGITIATGATNWGSIFFARGTGSAVAYRGYIEYGQTDDYMGFGTVSTERMRILANGNVAIGGTSAPQKVTITASAYPILGFNIGSTAQGYIGSLNGGGIAINSQIAQPLMFYTNDINRLQITPTGRVIQYSDGFVVGSGASNTVAGGSFLAVANAAQSNWVLQQLNGSFGLDWWTYSVASGWLQRMTLTSAGRVGINTISPQAFLHVADGNTGTKLMIEDTYGGNGRWGLGAGIGGLNDTHFTLKHENSSTTVLTATPSGNVGIGTTNPSGFMHIKGGNNNSLYVDNDGSQYTPIYVSNNGTVKGFLVWDNTSAIFQLGAASANPLGFYTNSTERMRISSTGDILVNRTTPAYSATGMTQVSVNGSSRGALSLTYTGSSSTGIMWYGSEQIDIYNTSTTGSIKVWANTNGVILGVNGTSWSSASDERLKTDILPIQNGLEKIASLRAITGRYKTDKEGTSRSFLIAQDVQSVLPEAVSINPSDGHLNLSYTEVIPLLVASIKELKVQVDELKANNR